MRSILKYSFYEMIRSQWIYIYTAFFIILEVALYLLSDDVLQSLISTSNISLAICPLIGILFGTIYFYNTRDFIQVFLSQPLSRWSIFLALYGGLALALCLCIFVGMGIPLILFGALGPKVAPVFIIILITSALLSIIFSLLSFNISMKFDNRVKGLSFSIILWLFFAVIYDGIVLLLLMWFKDYPLDKLTIGLVICNPIDLARILTIMKLDLSAMMGYTGAVLTKFLGSNGGMILIVLSLLLWIALPLLWLKKQSQTKDF